MTAAKADPDVAFFLSMVTATLDNRPDRVPHMLDAYLDVPNESQCARMGVLAGIAPQVAAVFAKKLSPVPPTFVMPPGTPAVEQETILLDCVRARMTNDPHAIRTAWSAIADLHDTRGCDAIKALVLMAVYLCVGLQLQQWRNQHQPSAAVAPPCPPAAPPPGCALQE